MKAALAFLLLAGCVEFEPQPVPEPVPGTRCEIDAQCGAGVCARTGECTTYEDVRVAHLYWTIATKPVNATSCANGPDIVVELKTVPEVGQGEVAEFGPVACTLGQFTIDKLPSKYWFAGVRNREAGMAVPFDETWTARLDLPF